MTIDRPGTVNLLDDVIDFDLIARRWSTGPMLQSDPDDGEVRGQGAAADASTGTIARRRCCRTSRRSCAQQVVDEEVEEERGSSRARRRGARRGARARPRPPARLARAVRRAATQHGVGTDSARSSALLRALGDACVRCDDRQLDVSTQARALLARGGRAARGDARVDLRRAHATSTTTRYSRISGAYKESRYLEPAPTARRSSTRAWKAARFGTACRSSARSGSRRDAPNWIKSTRLPEQQQLQVQHVGMAARAATATARR